MEKFCLLLILSLSGLRSFSQQDYFMYIQAEERQPFYAVINTKVYSSSESGYMIIPKLHDSNYQIMIGFAKNAFPEQRFEVTVNKKDLGFQLKHFDDKGWGLFNLQTLAVIMNSGQEQKTTESITGTKKTDAFSTLLANVVNDSAILYISATQKMPEPEKQQPLQVVTQNESEKTDTQVVAVSTPLTGHLELKEKKDTIEIPAEAKKSATDNKNISITTPEPASNTNNNVINNSVKAEKAFVSKLEERKTNDTYYATYLEQYNFVTDTIRISIPFNDVSVLTPSGKEETVTRQPAANETVVSPSVPSNNNTVDTRRPSVSIVNSDCKNFASENDVDKLRVRLLNDNTIEDKIKSTRRFFKNRCMTVKQVKALSELFPTDETKLLFFETSYPFVSDSGNIYILEDMLQNNNYKTRFKDMITQ